MSNELEVRSYRGSDENDVILLWNLVFPDDPPWNEPREVIRRKLTVQPELFRVATVDQRLAGTVLAGFDGVRGWIHHLAVHPAQRRLGLGTRLLRSAERHLAEAGCPKLNLQVRSGNETAVRFYERLGFQIEDRVSFGKRLESPDERDAS